MTTSESKVLSAFQALGIATDSADFQQLRQLPIHLHVNQGARQGERLVAARACANILTRVFPTVNLTGVPPQLLLPIKHPNLPKPLAPGQVPDIVMAFADVDVRTTYAGARVVDVDNRGWTARLSTAGPWTEATGSENLLAAYFAGCWAAADAFNARFQSLLPRAQPVDGNHHFDVFSGEENRPIRLEPNLLTSPVDLDDVALVGVGSIGQAFVEALGYVPILRGSLHLIDFEETDESNESRYVLSFPHNRGQPKVQIGLEHLQNLHPPLRIIAALPIAALATANITQRAHATEVKVFSRTFQAANYATIMNVRRRPFRRIAVAVDSESVRRDIQMGLHCDVFNAWSHTEDGNLAYSVGHHRINGQQACMACIYHIAADQEPGPVEFAVKMTGWTREKVVARLVENPQHPTSQEEVKELGRRRGLPPEFWQQLVNKPLAEVIHNACGLASLSHGDRNIVAPVGHVTAIAGALLAVAVVRDALGVPPSANISISDALRLPTSLAKETRNKVSGCLCTDADVQRAYAAEWQPRA